VSRDQRRVVVSAERSNLSVPVCIFADKNKMIFVYIAGGLDLKIIAAIL